MVKIILEKPIQSKNKFIGTHWAKKHQETKEWEREIWANCNGRPPKLEGMVSVKVTSYRRKLLDPDNLWTVGLLDAMRRLGIFQDDSSDVIELTKSQIKIYAKQIPKTEIIIEKIAK